MTDSALTLMAVHAHPDDEATSTGGTLARYAAEGVRTVLVTCTNGEMGDGLGGAKPGEPGHRGAEVVEERRRELEESCRILGIAHLEMLGYRDSGMMGWPANDEPDAFWNLDAGEAAEPLVDLMKLYRPDVVVTYDDFGFYGHPDHIQAHRITMAALDRHAAPVKLYFPTIRRSLLAVFREKMAEAGVEPPEIDEERFGSPDEDISATLDCRSFAAAKLGALRAHASQGENIFFTQFELEEFTEMFCIEEFIRVRDHTGSPIPENDLFAGLR